MRITHLIVQATMLVVACSPDGRSSLGRFEQNKSMVIVTGGTLHQAVETNDTWSCRVSARDYTKPFGERDFSACPCRGRATLHRAKNGNDASLLQYSLQHCPGATIVGHVSEALNWYVPEEHRDQLAKDLERPGRDQQRPEHRKVEATHIYGDRTVEMTWTRDVFRGGDGSSQLQDTESIFVAVRPRKSTDREHVRATTEPVISPTPRCP